MATPTTNFITSKADQTGTMPLVTMDPPHAHAAGSAGVTDPPPEDDLRASLDEDLNKLREAIIKIWEIEDDIRRPFEERSDAAKLLYNSEFDNEDKADWQSKRNFPKVFSAVERLAAAIVSMWERAPNKYGVKATIPEKQVFVNLAKRWLAEWLDHDLVQFGQTFRQLCKQGVITGQMILLCVMENLGYPMIVEGVAAPDEPTPEVSASDVSLFSQTPSTGPESDSNPFLPYSKLPRLRIELLNDKYVWVDSSGRNRYRFWETRYSLGEFLEEAEVRGFDAVAVERVRLLKAEERQLALDAFNRGENPDPSNYHQEIKLLNCEGTFFDSETGDKLMDNGFMIIAQDQEIVLGPVKNAHWDGESAMIFGRLIPFPQATYGKGIVGENLDSFDLQVEFLNMLVDFFQQSLLSMKEVDKDMLDEDEDLEESGFFPGKVINTRKQGREGTAVKSIPVADLPAGFWQFLQFFQQHLQETTMLTQELGGMPRTRGRITGMEYMQRNNDAGQQINFIFYGIEQEVLGPLLRRAFLRLLQFTPDKTWKEWVTANISTIVPKNLPPAEIKKWTDILNECAGWNAKKRFTEIGGFLQFRVEVFSSLVERQMDIEKGAFLLNTLRQVPGAFNVIRFDVLARHLVRAFGWDEEELIRADALPSPLTSEMAPPGAPGEPPVAPDMLGGFMSAAFPGGPSSEGPEGMPSEPPGFGGGGM